MNKISISTGSLPRLENRNFYELSSIINMMQRFMKQSKADGFEFVLFPEWDSENPPLTLTSAPLECEKHSVKEIIEYFQGKKLPILSVHANRDIGNHLCSEETVKVEKGTRLIQECLDFTRHMSSKICVFHFWDTFKEKLDLLNLQTLCQKFQSIYPEIEMSIENIPTICKNNTPFQIAQDFKYKTLDLKWASLFNEFDLFADIIDQVDNVHIQGKYENGRLVPSIGNLNYEQALKRIKEAGYSGVLTIELEGKADYKAVLDYISKLKEYFG